MREIAALAARRKPPPARSPPTAGKWTSEQVEAMAARVIAHVKAKAGHRLERIGKGLRIATKELELPVAKLLAAKKLRTKGRKPGTRYPGR